MDFGTYDSGLRAVDFARPFVRSLQTILEK